MTRTLLILPALLSLALALEAGAQTITLSGPTSWAKTCWMDADGIHCHDHFRYADMPIVEPLPPRKHHRNSLLMPNVIDLQYADGQEPLPPPKCRHHRNAPDPMKGWGNLPLCGMPAPMDVPAIQETSKERCFYEDTKKFCIDHTPLHWTCADKSRILLTDESGARHCVKFGGAQ